MSTVGPTLPSQKLWSRREAHFQAVVKLALTKLHQTKPHLDSECDLNRKLYFQLLEASRALDPQGNQPAPIQEACNQPDPDDPTRARRESKRPDFQWIFLDPHDPDPKRARRQFIVECKRLGQSGAHQWVLNDNYVTHGVMRFVHQDWAYAKGCSSALMVGYWQNMAIAQVLNDVNTAIMAATIRLPVLAQKPGIRLGGPISEFEHQVNPTFVVTSLKLAHWWVDVR